MFKHEHPRMSAVLVLLAATLFMFIALAFALVTDADGDAPAASFTAIDSSWFVTGTTTTIAQIQPGQSVEFSYPSGFSTHNADFGSPAPTSCTQTSGPDSGPVPPLPGIPTAPGWSGICTFNTEQTYKFHCDLHTGMQGIIVVGSGGPAAGGGGGGGNGGGATSPNTANSLATDSLKVSRSQRTTRIRGSAQVAVDGSKLIVEAYVKSSALSSSATKRVGRVVKSSLAPGKTSFVVALNKRARTAFKTAGKLSVTLKARLIDPNGTTVHASRSVKLKK